MHNICTLQKLLPSRLWCYINVSINYNNNIELYVCILYWIDFFVCKNRLNLADAFVLFLCTVTKQMVFKCFCPVSKLFFQRFHNCVRLTSSILSSSISLNTVPLIWLGFSATQLNTGIRNLVLMGFLIFTATQHDRKNTSQSCKSHKHKTCSLIYWVMWSRFVNSRRR